MNELTKPECGKCVFFKRLDAYGGECRRYAPRRNDTNSYALFPKIGGLSWCGEFEEKGEQENVDN